MGIAEARLEDTVKRKDSEQEMMKGTGDNSEEEEEIVACDHHAETDEA